MDTLDIIRTTQGRSISIPSFHYASISLMPEFTYTAAFFDKAQNNLRLGTKPNEKDFYMPQIVLTPFPFSEWDHLWKVTCVLEDRPGAVNALVSIMQRFCLNILAQTSIGVELNNFHAIQIIVSASQVCIPNYENEASLKLVEETILAERLNDIRFRKVGRRWEPSLVFERMYSHQNLWEEHRQRFYGGASSRFQGEITAKAGNNSPITVEIPEEWYFYLRQVNGYEGETPDMRYILHTNIDQQLLAIYFPQRHRVLKTVRVIHRDEIGAIATMTEAMRDAGINLFSTLTRKATRELNHFEFIYEAECASEQDLLELVISALQTPKVLYYRPVLEVPPRQVIAWNNWEQVWSWEQAEKSSHELFLPFTPPERPDDTSIRQVVETLKEQLQERVGEYDTGSIRQQNITARIDVANDLLLNSAFAKPRMFLSFKMDKDENELVRCIRDIFEDFDVVVARNFAGAPEVSEAIIATIKTCHFYLGILTPDEEGVTYPSPWIMWEYGVSLGHPGCLDMRLARDTRVDIRFLRPAMAYEIISFEMPSPFVCTDDFKEYLTRIAAEFRETWRDRP